MVLAMGMSALAERPKVYSLNRSPGERWRSPMK